MKSWLKYGAIILIIVLFIVAFFIGKKDEETTKKEHKPMTVSTSQLSKDNGENKDKKINSADKQIAETKVTVDEEEVTAPPKLEKDSFNYNKTLSNEFGKKKIKEGEKLAENVIKMYIDNMKNIEKYQNQINDTLFKNMMRDKVDDDGVQRIVKISKSTLLPNQKNGIAFEVEVSWDLKNNGVVTKGRDALVYVNLTLENDTWIVESMRFI